MISAAASPTVSEPPSAYADSYATPPARHAGRSSPASALALVGERPEAEPAGHPVARVVHPREPRAPPSVSPTWRRPGPARELIADQVRCHHGGEPLEPSYGLPGSGAGAGEIPSRQSCRPWVPAGPRPEADRSRRGAAPGTPPRTRWRYVIASLFPSVGGGRPGVAVATLERGARPPVRPASAGSGPARERRAGLTDWGHVRSPPSVPGVLPRDRRGGGPVRPPRPGRCAGGRRAGVVPGVPSPRTARSGAPAVPRRQRGPGTPGPAAPFLTVRRPPPAPYGPRTLSTCCPGRTGPPLTR